MTFSYAHCDYQPKQCNNLTFAGLCQQDSTKVWKPNLSKDQRVFCYSDEGSKKSKFCEGGDKWDYVDFHKKTDESGGELQGNIFCRQYCSPTEDYTCVFNPTYQMTCPPGYIQEPVCAYGKCTFDDNRLYTMVCGKAGGYFQGGLYYDALDNPVNSYDPNYLTTISGNSMRFQKACYDKLCSDICEFSGGTSECVYKVQ